MNITLNASDSILTFRLTRPLISEALREGKKVHVSAPGKAITYHARFGTASGTHFHVCNDASHNLSQTLDAFFMSLIHLTGRGEVTITFTDTP